jgi:hypothetical protein
MITVGLTVPSTAWAAHLAGHAVVSVGEHHHDKGYSDHDHKITDADEPAQDSPGHDHSPAVSFTMGEVPAHSVAIPAVFAKSTAPFAWTNDVGESNFTHRIKRPPRLA